MPDVIYTIQQQLFALQDTNYRDFHSRLIPTVDPNTIIGVRTPSLRKLAKQLSGSPKADLFLNTLPHTYYEENNLHAFLIETHTSYPKVIQELNTFLPFVDNWATCDMMSPRVFASHIQELYPQILLWLGSEHPYTIRYGIGMLLRHYLDQHFRPEHLARVSTIHTEEYYVNMMIAWYFATALSKQYSTTIPYLTNQILSPWIHNKTIQKAMESNRIDKPTKQYLRTLRRK